LINRQKTITAIDNILNAKSLAVVGVSSNPLKDGYTTLDTIIKGGYKGKLYPVNPRGGEICGVKVYTSLESIPDHLEKVTKVQLYFPVVFENRAGKIWKMISWRFQKNIK